MHKKNVLFGEFDVKIKFDDMNNWLKLLKYKKTDKMTHCYVYKIGDIC